MFESRSSSNTYSIFDFERERETGGTCTKLKQLAGSSSRSPEWRGGRMMSLPKTEPWEMIVRLRATNPFMMIDIRSIEIFSFCSKTAGRRYRATAPR